MIIRDDASKSISLAIAGLLLWMVVSGLISGEIWSLSKHSSDLIQRNESPGRFWLRVVLYGFFITITGATGALLAKTTWKELQH